MINNLGTASSELQINFCVLQIETENSTTGIDTGPWINERECSDRMNHDFSFIYVDGRFRVRRDSGEQFVPLLYSRW